MPRSILWIMADELRTDALGCYGPRDPRLETPAIDRLASSGAVFDRAYTASPVCVPARAAMLTGRSPIATGIVDNEAYDVPADLDPAFPELLAEHGWSTANYGKEHLPGGADPWQHSDGAGTSMPALVDAAQRAGSDIRRAPGLGHVYAATLPDEAGFDGDTVTRNAVEAIRDASEPFLIRASYLQPHRPAVLPRRWAERYRGIRFEVDTAESAAANEFERQFGRINRGAELDADEMDLALRMYYGAVAWFDAQVATLLGALEEAGRLDSTLVILTTDHGAHVGEAGAFGKHTFAPVSHRIPLVLSGPGVDRGVRRADLATSEDIAATVLGWAGVDAPDRLDGRDLLADPPPAFLRSAIGYGETWSRAFPNRDAGTWVDGRGWPQRVCIRTDRYRLDANTRIDGADVDLDGPDADLFLADSVRDPHESTNLVDDERSAAVLARLLEPLRAAQAELAAAPRPEARVAPGHGFGAV